MRRRDDTFDGVEVVPLEAFDDREFVRDVRATALAQEIPFRKWIVYVCGTYYEIQDRVVDHNGKKASLPIEVFDDPSSDFWFRRFCCTPVPPDVKPHVRSEARSRAQVVATILRATCPEESALWRMPGVAELFPIQLSTKQRHD